MGRLIDADELLYVLTREPHWYVRCVDKDFPGMTLKDVFSTINAAPTIEAIPIDWILNNERMPKDGKGRDAILDMIEDWRKENGEEN